MCARNRTSMFFFFNHTATTEIYTLSLHDALPIMANETINDPALETERLEEGVWTRGPDGELIPDYELSIRRSVNPADEVTLGDEIDALVMTKEDAEGRLILSKKRARFEI